MNRNRLYFGALLFVLVAIIAWTSYGMLNVGRKEECHMVSVIVEDSNNDRWIALRQGLEQAAGDYNIELNYVSTGRFFGLEEELALINRELENGAEGIIVQMISSETMDGIAGIQEQAALILLETDVTPEDLYAFAGPDNTAIGTALSDAVQEELGGTLAGTKIGILAGNQSQLSMQQRLAGVEAALAEAGVEPVWCADSRQAETKEAFDQIQQETAADIIIALSNDETEKMADYLQTEEGSRQECLLYGVGCSDKAVYYLDKGIISTLVVPNEFNMGYQSMETIANQLRYHLTETSDSRVDYLVIDKSNLYDADNQKVLFPLVQ